MGLTVPGKGRRGDSKNTCIQSPKEEKKKKKSVSVRFDGFYFEHVSKINKIKLLHRQEKKTKCIPVFVFTPKMRIFQEKYYTVAAAKERVAENY